tara:strand:+ start:34 stop:441 length:408 start_codon:yes stop_codon:yes gene_type:complete
MSESKKLVSITRVNGYFVFEDQPSIIEKDDVETPAVVQPVSVPVITSLSKDTVSSVGQLNMITSNLSPQLTSVASLAFTTDLTPKNEMLYLNGVYMTRGVDYTISGKTITFSSDYQGRIKIGSTLSIMYTTEESS